MSEIAGSPAEKPEIPECAISQSCQPAYTAATTDEGGDVQGRLSEALLAKALEDGATIRRAVVVDAAGDYMLFLRLSDRPGYLCVAKRRPIDGPKAWNDFRTLQRMLHKQGYRGAVCVFPEGSPFPGRLGISLGTPV